MKRTVLACTILCMAPVAAHAQTTHVPSDSVQIATAVVPLPEEFRHDATVLGYHDGSKELVKLRAGTGVFTCLADNPAEERFHVACYHNGLEPFMARGRTLRSHGVTNVDSVRFAEIKSGKLMMPRTPSALYSLTGPNGSMNSETGAITPEAKRLYVVYIPFATSKSTGLPIKPEGNQPWIMYPGTAKAHIMFVPGM